MDTLASASLTAVTLAMIAGLVVAVITWLTGSSRAAVAARGHASSDGASLRSALTEHRDVMAITAFGPAVLVIAVYGFSALPLLVASLLAAGGVAALVLPPSDAAAPVDQP